MGVAVLTNMVSMYINQKQYDSAQVFARKAHEAYKAQGNPVGMQKTVNQLMEIALASQDKTLAFDILNKNNALDLLGSDEYPLSDVKKALEYSYRLYKMLDDEQRAYHYLQPAYEVAAELRKQEMNKDLEKYELERKKVMQENKILANELQLKSKNNTILLLLITFLIIGAVAAFLLISYRKKVTLQKKKMELMEKETAWERERSVLKGQLEERNRISRELHDDLGASLTSIALSGEMMKSKNPEMKEDLHIITSSANDIVDTLNEIVWSLNSRNDSLQGLVAYIRKFASGYLDKLDIHFEYKEALPDEDISVPSNIRRAVYLTAKEAFNNIAKHSKADKATMKVGMVAGKLNIIISDNGKGLLSINNSSSKSNGNGLHNMKKNMEQVGGSCSVENKEGTVVHIEVVLG